MTTIPSPAVGMRELGDYLRAQRVAANLSVRQLSAVTGISNPYLSQIERGLRRPSAEILQQLALGLSISAESLYVRAGLLDPAHAPYGSDARAAIRNDPRLDGAQRRALLDVYARIVGEPPYQVVDTPPVGGADPQPAPSLAPSHRSQLNEETSMNAKSGKRSARRTADSPALTPFYAAVGASDLAVEKLRDLGVKAAKDAEQGIDDLQHRAEHDVAKVVKGARQVPQLALNQALEVVARGRQQYEELARRGKDVDVPTQAASTAVGLMKQATEIVGRGRSQAEHVVEAGRNQAEHVVEAGRHEAARRVSETGKVARRTTRAAREQAEHVADQAAHVVDAVTHVGRQPVAATVTVTTEVKKPTARRRRSPGAGQTAAGSTTPAVPAAEPTRSVASAGVEAGSTTTTRKAAAKKSASATAAASTPATMGAPSSSAKRATSAKRAKATTKAPAGPVPTPKDMPSSPAVQPPAAPTSQTPKPESSPGDKLPPRSDS